MTSPIKLVVDFKGKVNELVSEKVTVRKVAVEDVSAWLENKTLINALTAESLKSNPGFSWMDLWNKVVNHSKIEMDKWLKDVEKKNSTVGAKELSIHLKCKKNGILDMPRLILSKCVDNPLVMKGDIILDDLLQFLSPSMPYLRTKKAFGADVIDIIASRILSSKTFTRALRIGSSNCNNQWKSLLDLAFEMLKGKMSIDDLTLVKSLEFAYQVIFQGSKYSSFWSKIRQNFKVFFILFEKNNFKKGPADTKIAVMKLLNAVQDILKREARILLCNFGEKVAQDIVVMTEENKTEELIIEFFNMQMCLHHPLGARDKDQGAFIGIDPDIWLKQILPNIFDGVVVQTVKTKQKYNRMRRDYRHEIGPNLLTLAICIARQLYVNVGTEGQSSQQQQPPPNKRLKFDQFSFQEGILGLVQFDASKEKEEVMIPWIQILNGLIEYLNDDEFDQAVVKLLDLLKQSRSAQVKDHLLRCCSSLVQRRNLNSSVIWDAAINIDNQCIDSGHHLLRTMIRLELNSDLDKVYKLYLDRRLRYSSASVRTLLLLLTSSKKMDPEYRLSILRWLVPHDEHWIENVSGTKWFWSLDQDTLSKCFVALMVPPKSMHHVIQELKEIEAQSSCSSSSSMVDIKTFEDRLLESVHLVLPVKIPEKKLEVRTPCQKITFCPILKEEIKDVLIQLSGAIMEKLKNTSTQQQQQTLYMIQMALNYCHLLDLIYVKMQSIALRYEEENRFENVIANLACQALNSLDQVLTEKALHMEKLKVLIQSWNMFQTKKIQNECNAIFLKYLKLLMQGSNKEALFGDCQVNDDFGEDKEAKQLAMETVQNLSRIVGKGVSCSNDHQIVEFTESLKSFLDEIHPPSKVLHIITSGLEGLFSDGQPKFDQLILYRIFSLLQSLVKVLFLNYQPDDFENLMSWVALCIGNIDTSGEKAPLMKKNAMTFVHGFLSVQSTKRLFSPKVEISLVLCIAKLAEKDLHGTWANFTLKVYQMASHEEDHDVVETEKIPSYLLLSKFTRNPCQMVRDEAIQQFHRIVPQLPDAEFKRLLTHLTDIMHAWRYVPSQEELVEARDQSANILASKLNIFLPLLSTRPKSTLSVMKAVVRVWAQSKDSMEPLKVAMKTLSQNMSEDMKLLLKPLLGQLMFDFIQYANVKNFPYGFIADDLKSLLVENEEELIPILLNHYAKDATMVEYLCSLLQKSVANVVEDNFAHLASIYSITFYLQGQSDPLNMLCSKSMSIEKHTEKLNSVFPEVIALILRRLKDSRHFEDIFGEKPDVDTMSTTYSNLNLASVQRFMSALQESFPASRLSSSSSLLCGLVNLQPDSLQRLLSTVFKPLQSPNQAVLLGWQACFHAVWFILDTLQQDMKCNSNIEPFWPYASYYILMNCSFLYSKKQEEIVRKMCLKVIEKVLLVYVQLDEDWSDKNHVLYASLPMVVNTIISCGHEGQEECLLLQLILRHKKQWKTGEMIFQFEPFPKELSRTLGTKELSVKSLTEELVIFNQKARPQQGSLSRLKNILQECKSDIRLMVVQLMKTRGFSEDAKNSLLHQTLRKLTDLSKCNRELKSVANECLGVIGPLDLQTKILFPTEIPLASEALVQVLKKYVVSPNSSISQSAIDGLKKALATSSEFSSEDPILVSFRQVFPQSVKNPSFSSSLSLNCQALEKRCQDYHGWYPKEKHDVWITSLVVHLLKCYPKVKDAYLSKSSSMYGLHLVPLALKVPEFCRVIFPGLVHDMLQVCRDLKESHFRQGISTFFGQYFISREICDEECLKTMLQLVAYLRTQSLGSKSSKWDDHFWIPDLNYLHVAFAAFQCQEFTSCVAYCDVWCYSQLSKSGLKNDIKNSQAIGCLRKSLIDAIDEAKLQDSKLCQTLLADSYSALAEPYAVQGCGSRRNLDLQSHMQHLLAQKEFPIALAMFDAHLNIEQQGMENSSQNYEYYQRGLLTSMEETGLDHTLKEYQKNCHQELASWHDFDHSLEQLTGLLVDKNFAEDTFENQLHLLQSKQMNSKNVIIMTKMYDSMANLQILNEMKDFQFALDSENMSDNNGLKEMIANCVTYENDKQFMDYKYLKRILKQRCKILQGILNIEDYNNQRSSPSKVRLSKSKAIQKISLEALITNSFQLVENAHDNEDFGFGYKTLLELDKVCHLSSRGSSSEFFQDKIKYEKCRLFWAWGQKDEAAKQLDFLIKHLRRTSIPSSRGQLLPDALSLLGSWMWHLRSHSSTAILEDCFLESIRLYKEQLQEAASLTNNDGEGIVKQEQVKTFVNDLAEAYIRLATFCDEQYTLIVNYMNSKDYEDKQAILQEMSHDHKMMKEEKVKGTTTLVILERNSNLDKREMMAKMEERNNFLTLALENYAQALANQNEKNDMKIYRWISLWFANPENAAANQIVETALQHIPDYKFVGLLYQLCARMVTAEPTGTFSSILESLILKCGTQHPYHTLPIILALVNSNLDEVIEKPLKGGKNEEENSLAPRAKVAKKVLQKLKQARVEINDIAKKTELLSVALIQLAYKKPENDKRNSISRNDPLMKLQRMEDVLLPTHSLPISKVGGDWYFNDNHLANEFCGIAHFATEYHMVGGINAPKKMSCVGTDGKSRPQLLKGRDDLRQDAVMQQVFGLINSLLKQSVPKSQLGIRTFKVVPLSQRSGILEWCVNTEPISDFLIGPDKISGAHGKYHPQEWKAKKCQAMMAEVSKKCAQKRAKAKDLQDRAKVETESKALLIKIFQDICQNFTPVFRHFFYENFPNVDRHFERRLAYTRSCAASSMVGYILGLGDRHIHNILIDKYSAELVHIDLGIAFEQGKILPTPETVPFRLTRDIIDGFGPSGVEGTFRKSAEATMRVLRSNKDAILTILEVLMFDPLYNWSLTPAQAYRIQHGKQPPEYLLQKWENFGRDGKNTNKLAERALLRVTQKLEGREEGSKLSVEGQVNSLIQQATDPNNLALLFAGWQAYV